ncbi:MAG: hypothetical protein M3P27_01125 [Acidobacteriota bacterium]|nr:hypothetical protein [Acidobacteriota bacterium]
MPKRQARRKSGPGFGGVLALALVIAAGFAALLYWRSHKSDFENLSTARGTAAIQHEPQPETPPTPAPTPTPEASARPASTQQVQLSPTSTLYFWPAADFVHFEFEVAAEESPVLDVDYNQNGHVDARVDRSYGLDAEGTFCPVYFIRGGGVGGCGGAPSVGSVTVTPATDGRKTVAFVIPKHELSADLATARLTFGICRLGASACEHFPADSIGFAKSYMIEIR